MNTLDVLKAARAKLAQGWTQEMLARDWQGAEVPSHSDEALCWCMVGAIHAVTQSEEERNAALLQLELSLGQGELCECVTEFNDDDGTTIEDVLALCDRAIAEAA